MVKFDPEKHYLGTLCKRGHDWNGTEKSLRYKSHRGCYECQKLLVNGWKSKNRSKCNASRRKWYAGLDEIRKARFLSVNKPHTKKHKGTKQYREWADEYKRSESRKVVCARYYQRKLLKSAIALADTLPDKEGDEILVLVEARVDERLAVLNLKKRIKEIQSG